MDSCKICGAFNWEPVYRGRVRLGASGHGSDDFREVFRCGDCGAQCLPGVTPDEDYYQGDAYRKTVGQENSLETYHLRHDPELNYLLDIVPVEMYRNKVVMDVGCGGGSFLDIVKGVAACTIGVDPNASFRQGLERRGHTAFPNIEMMLDTGRKVDIAVSFNVIEHLSDPVELVRGMRSALQVNGRAILMTPNANDFLVNNGPLEYKEHFYRTVHQWYFNDGALERLVRNAGFHHVEVKYCHTYPLSNALYWMRDRQGRGHQIMIDDPYCDWVWKQYLEKSRQADRLVCIASLEK